MQNLKKSISPGLIIGLLFSTMFITRCANKEKVSQNNACDLNDNVCCDCTATYIQVGQVAATQRVCTPAEKQSFMTTWTDPLIRIDCKR